MNTLRLFISLDLPQNIKQEIGKIEWELSKQNLPFRFENEQKLHLTLAFLGSTPQDKIPILNTALSSVAQNLLPFTLYLTNLGAFSGFNHPRILYVGLSGQIDILEQLQKNLLPVLKENGFKPRTNNTFTSHITIARLAKTPYPIHLKNIGNFISGLKIKIPKLEFEVNSLSLMQSKLSSKGSSYKTIKMFNFPPKINKN